MFRFKCGSCDNWHEGSPSLACQVPDPLLRVPPEEREYRVALSSETAVLDNTRFFIRACLEVPIHDTDERFVWGLWAEVSREDFVDYCQTSEKGSVGGPYLGTLANALPFYPECNRIPVSVEPQAGDQRPLLITPEGENSLTRHQHGGMPEADARAYFERVLHPGGLH